MKNILLINPWIADFTAYDLWAKPLGLLYIGKFLHHYGYDLELIDLTDRLRWGGDKPAKSRGKYPKTLIPKPPVVAHVPRRFGLYGASRKQFAMALKNVTPPKLILVTSHMTYWYPGVRETVTILRDTFPETIIVLGGIYASLFPDHAHQTIQPDYLITGYGEKPVLELSDRIFGISRDYSTVPKHNDAGMLPWDLYPNLNVAPILTSRGCPMHCDYCATPLLNPQFSQREPADVLAEILFLYHQRSIREFAFYDDALFTHKEQHIKPILRGLIKENLAAKFHTPNGLFAREIDAGLAELMRATGFETIRLSMESVIPKWQKASSNKVSTRDFENALVFLENAGFQRKNIEVYIIMGLPGQRYSDVETTLRYVFEQGTISRLAAFSPIPQTPFWQIAKERGCVSDDMDPLLTNNTIYPCASRDFPVEKFLELRQLSNDLNAKIRTNMMD
ncbi:MAG TPA: radical SAM protein [Candidatus Marinimicrobia bacterium]|nr:radical SAM protein [Candidatus Neomarinimicrobiota bacterium]